MSVNIYIFYNMFTLKGKSATAGAVLCCLLFFSFLVLRHWSCSLPVIVGGDDIIYLILISDQLDL